MKIEYLADHTEFIPILATWFFEQWGYLRPESRLEDFAERVRAHANRKQMPLSFVALDGAKLLGSASLREQDMSTRRFIAVAGQRLCRSRAQKGRNRSETCGGRRREGRRAWLRYAVSVDS